MKRPAMMALCLGAATAWAGCAADAGPDETSEPVEVRAMLGPVDGHDLPPSDLERVQVGDPAPDFTLASLAGPNVTLSDFQGDKNVVLVFYRGHW